MAKKKKRELPTPNVHEYGRAMQKAEQAVAQNYCSTEIGKVYAAGANWATDRAQRLHTAKGVITGNQDDIVIITRSGIEALLRDAYAAGHYSTRKQE